MSGGTHSYIATFFSHYDAVRFAARAQGLGIAAKLMPVPRAVSSSCGTGARFSMADESALGALADDEGVDRIYRHDGGAYELRYDSDS